MIERWMRDPLTSLKGAIEKLRRGDEGDFKQALIIADHATEAIMRNYLIFEKRDECPRNYPKLLEKVRNRSKVPTDVIEVIMTYRMIRDGFQHHNIEKIREGLKGTTTGLTLEKSYLEEYLNAVTKLFEGLTGIKLGTEGDQDAKAE